MINIDPSQVFREARNLARSGAYAEALEKHLWFHENALVHDPSLCGVRLSVALRDWIKLGELYPPARDALEFVRDAKAITLREGSLDRELFYDVESINEVLGHVECTSALCAEIALQNRDFARKCFRAAFPALVRTQNFSLARSFISSPTETLGRFVSRLNKNIRNLPAPATESSAELSEVHVEIYVEEVILLLDLLIGIGDVDEAKLIVATAVDSVACSVTCDEIREQLRRRFPQALDYS
jgi:hypothetical protein